MMRSKSGWNDIGVSFNGIINVGLLKFEVVMQTNDVFLCCLLLVRRLILSLNLYLLIALGK